jgi:hypothetical protein
VLANVADAARHLVTLAGSAHAQLSREALSYAAAYYYYAALAAASATAAPQQN